MSYSIFRDKYFYFLLFADLLFLLYGARDLSISFSEAKIYYEQTTFLGDIMRLCVSLFGQSDASIRAPFFIIYIINIFLLAIYAKTVVKKSRDTLYVVAIYLLFPGVVSSALLVSKAGFLIMLILTFLITLQKHKLASFALLGLYCLLDNAFSLLFISLFFYSIYKKDGLFALYTLLLFGINMYIFGFDDGGTPKGYFLDTFAVFAVIFSPLLFVYFFYTVYRILIKEEKSILWYIVFVPLVFALLLSFRQKIRIEDFAPFLALAAPLMVRTFLEGYRVRLPQYRGFYKKSALIALSVGGFLFFSAVFSKLTYHLYDNPKAHFAYRYHVAKELALELKKLGITKIDAKNSELALRLKFYGISESSEYILAKGSSKECPKKIEIEYYGRVVDSYCLLVK